MTASRYANLLLTVIFVAMFSVLGISYGYVVRPQTGDLSRIGGLVEHNYGAQSEAARLGWSRPEARLAKFEKDGNRELGDVLVFGDSFSLTGTRFNWATALALRLGVEVRLASIASVGEIVQSPPLPGHSPKLLILQSVERDVVDYLVAFDRRLPEVESVRETAPPIPIKESPSNAGSVVLEKKSFRGFEDRMSVTLDYLSKQLPLQFGRLPDTLTRYRIKQGSPRFFSSRRFDWFYAIPEDKSSSKVTRNKLSAAARGYMKLKRLVELRGDTHFQLLVIPNRYSVYQEYLKDEPAAPPVLQQLGQLITLYDPLPLFKRNVDAGVQDIYWPMDTHLSAVGSKLLAKDYASWLMANGVFEFR